MGINVIYLNIIKVIYGKIIGNIILNAGNVKAFVLEVLATAIRQENLIKIILIEKEEVNLSLFPEDMIL